jgi:hypothetical protein
LHRHGELIEYLDSIRKVVEGPDLVFHDSRFQGRESYYSFGIVEGFERYYIKVSVEFDTETPGGRSQGTIISAYIARNVKPGEVLKWRRTSSPFPESKI